jgi:hypothetical protein
MNRQGKTRRFRWLRLGLRHQGSLSQEREGDKQDEPSGCRVVHNLDSLLQRLSVNEPELLSVIRVTIECSS